MRMVIRKVNGVLRIQYLMTRRERAIHKDRTKAAHKRHKAYQQRNAGMYGQKPWFDQLPE